MPSEFIAILYVPTVIPMLMHNKIIPKIKKLTQRPLANVGPTEETFRQ